MPLDASSPKLSYPCRICRIKCPSKIILDDNLKTKGFFPVSLRPTPKLKNSMVWNKTAISVSELKRLLYELRDRQPYTYIRVRSLGDLWKQNFMMIFNISEAGVILYDETLKRLFKISDLSTIIQFELDNNFQEYRAHFHYDVSLDDISH